MSSRYDIAIFRDTTLDRFLASPEMGGEVGEVVAGPWSGPEQTSLAEIATDASTHVVVTAPPEGMPSGTGRYLAEDLGIEAIFATVQDSVGTYSLEIRSPEIRRTLRKDIDGERYEFGEPVPEEDTDFEIDEAYIQLVAVRRTGIDPGNLPAGEIAWHALI